jgi:hypothetical protein
VTEPTALDPEHHALVAAVARGATQAETAGLLNVSDPDPRVAHES